MGGWDVPDRFHTGRIPSSIHGCWDRGGLEIAPFFYAVFLPSMMPACKEIASLEIGGRALAEACLLDLEGSLMHAQALAMVSLPSAAAAGSRTPRTA